MELQQAEYDELLNHFDDLKRICEKLRLDLNLIEFPMAGMSDTAGRVVITTMNSLTESSSDSSEGSESNSSEASSESSASDTGEDAN